MLVAIMFHEFYISNPILSMIGPEKIDFLCLIIVRLQQISIVYKISL